jgi:hypothetical protein
LFSMQPTTHLIALEPPAKVLPLLCELLQIN